MSIALDIVIVLIIAFAAWRGFKNGLVRGVFGVLAIIIAIYGANLVAKAYSAEFTGMLQPFVSGIVDTAVADVIQTGDNTAAAEDTALTKDEKSNVFDVCAAALREIGVAKDAADDIAEQVSTELRTVGQQMSASLTGKLCDVLAYIVVFVIAFILIAIFFAVLGNIINLAFSIPGIEKLDKFAGLVLGLFKGVLIIFALAVIVRYVGLIPRQAVDETILLKFVVNINPLAHILGI